MTDNPAVNWPYLSLSVPEEAESEQTAQITQAAVEAGALGAAHEVGRLVLYLPREADDALIQAIRFAVGEATRDLGWPTPSMTVDLLADQPWATAWKKDFVTFPVGNMLLIRPDWERDQPAPAQWPSRLPIWLRPGFGFGTGRHESTRLALEMLENHLEPGSLVLDFGSGSGVLAIAAVRLGAAEVTAIEYDADANENARDNFALNGCAARIHLHETPQPALVGGVYDLVICNMLPQNALPHMKTLAGMLESPQAVLIYSGFLTDQKREIEAALVQGGLIVDGAARMNEWSALLAHLGPVRS